MDQQIGNYLLLRPLGESDFSTVFLGEDRQRHTYVAIKVLHERISEDEADAFIAHISALSQLRHPHIITLQDFGIEDGMAYMVMDYATQGTVRQRYPKGTRIPLSTISLFVDPIAAALHYLHELGLVHRDIKPHNILIDAQDTILLGDLGTVITSYNHHPGQFPLQDFEGTVLYAAPEQLQGKPCQASDQYAFGVMLYEWICGTLPFNGTFHEVVHQHLFTPPAALTTRGLYCPPNIEQVIMRALEKNPRKRFANIKLFADEFIWACKLAQARGEIIAPETSPLHQPSQRPSPTTVALPTTPPPISAIQPAKTPRRQFKSPQPFSPK